MCKSVSFNVAIVGYREWAYKIYEDLNLRDFNILSNLGVNYYWVSIDSSCAHKNPHFYFEDPNNYEMFSAWSEENEIDLIVFAGWSWFVPDSITSKNTCLCIHPGDLRMFRGGSPLQHQILNGNKSCIVTLFKMTNITDWGPIFGEHEISILGYIPEIFSRISDASIIMLRKVIQSAIFDQRSLIRPMPDFKKGVLYSRRKPSDSILNLNDLSSYSTEYLLNLFRSLTGPYPPLKVKSFNCDMLLKIEAMYQVPYGNECSVEKVLALRTNNILKIDCLDGRVLATYTYVKD